MNAWSGKPCHSCGKKKGKNQRDRKYCATCQRAKDRQSSRAAHGIRIQATYGITEAEYWALYEFQGGRCAICRIATGKTRRLSVDHDHSCLGGHPPNTACPACVRGLLCRPCNTLLGRARDAVAFFQRCIEYLQSPPWRQLQELRRRKVP